MRPDIQAILSCSLTFGVPLILALREIFALRRGGGWRPERTPEDDKPRPLPPCLLVHFEPRPSPPVTEKLRLLEPV